jgi:hypothetical protein
MASYATSTIFVVPASNSPFTLALTVGFPSH